MKGIDHPYILSMIHNQIENKSDANTYEVYKEIIDSDYIKGHDGKEFRRFDFHRHDAEGNVYREMESFIFANDKQLEKFKKQLTLLKIVQKK